MKSNTIKQVLAALPLCLLPLTASAAPEPREQFLEILNRCTHEVQVEAKQRPVFRPWKDIPNRFALQPDESLQTIRHLRYRFFLPDDEMQPPPQTVFRYQKQEMPSETVYGDIPEEKLRTCQKFRIVACPENMKPQDKVLTTDKLRRYCSD